MFEPEIIIVGAGFAGSVMAERYANKGKKVLLIDKQNHLGGHSYDYRDEDGVLIHKYGPHIFHTNNEEVFKYLSKFTEWIPYQHKVLTHINGEKVPLPFNLNSLYALFPLELAKRLEQKLISKFGYGKKIPIFQMKKDAEKTNDKELIMLANFVFEKAFLNYTRKQWAEEPENLMGVLERVPISISRDNRYFQDKYQFMPKKGYNKLFTKMLKNQNIKIMLNTSFEEIIKVNLKTGEISFFNNIWEGTLIFTGKIDSFFNKKFGALPYRSLEFKEKRIEKENFLEVPVENFPNNFKFTRINEYKLFYEQGKQTGRTKIFEEYPLNHDGINQPYYPIPKKENQELYNKYKKEVEKLNSLKTKNKFLFVGRLAEYRYYNMDGVVAKALTVFKENNL